MASTHVSEHTRGQNRRERISLRCLLGAQDQRAFPALSLYSSVGNWNWGLFMKQQALEYPRACLPAWKQNALKSNHCLGTEAAKSKEEPSVLFEVHWKISFSSSWRQRHTQCFSLSLAAGRKSVLGAVCPFWGKQGASERITVTALGIRKAATQERHERLGCSLGIGVCDKFSGKRRFRSWQDGSIHQDQNLL